MNLSCNVDFYRRAKEIGLWFSLIFSLVFLNFSDLLGQVAQSGQFMFPKTDISSNIDIQNDMPKYTCNIQQPTINFITVGVTSSTSTNRDLQRYIIDSMKFETERVKLFERIGKQKDSIHFVRQHIALLSYEIERHLTIDCKNEVAILYELNNRISKAENKINENLKTSDTLRYRIATDVEPNVEKILKKFHAQQDTFKNLLLVIKNTESSLESKIKDDVEKRNKQEIVGATIPQLSDVSQLNNPTITFLGSTKIYKNGLVSLGLYTGVNSKDTLSFNSIIVPELSKWGVQLSGYNKIADMKIAKWTRNVAFWLNYALNFHEKNTFDKFNQVDFNFSRLQTRVGLEIFIINDIISIYGNSNYIRPVSNSNSYKINFNLPTKNHWYFDYGVRIFLKNNTISQNGLGLFADLNFTYLNDSFTKFNPQNDSSKSLIKIGLQQNFR